VSNYIFDMPHGGEVVADPPTHAFGQPWPTATPEALAICRDLGFRELSEDEIDFGRTSTSHKKVWLANGEYRRYHAGTLESAGDAGVDCYFIQSPGFLVLLHPLNAEKVKSERLGDVPVGREAEPGLRIRPNWQPGQPPILPRR
jgi:hypothetical protein